MQALGLGRDALIQTMGIWFSIGAVALCVAIVSRGALPANPTIVSAGTVMPAIIGMELDRRLRQALIEALFRNFVRRVTFARHLYRDRSYVRFSSN